MKTQYLVAPIGLLLAACSSTKTIELPLVYSPECKDHSLTFESYKDGEIDYEFKDDPTQDTAVHIVVTPANQRYRLFNDGRVAKLSPYIDPPQITEDHLASLMPKFMEHDVTFIQYDSQGSYELSFIDNRESTRETHVVVMPDTKRFRIWNDGRIETVTDDDKAAPQFTTRLLMPKQ